MTMTEMASSGGERSNFGSSICRRKTRWPFSARTLAAAAMGWYRRLCR